MHNFNYRHHFLSLQYGPHWTVSLIIGFNAKSNAIKFFIYTHTLSLLSLFSLSLISLCLLKGVSVSVATTAKANAAISFSFVICHTRNNGKLALVKHVGAGTTAIKTQRRSQTQSRTRPCIVMLKFNLF